MKFVYTPAEFCKYVEEAKQRPGIPLPIDRRPLLCNFGEPRWVKSECGIRNLEKIEVT